LCGQTFFKNLRAPVCFRGHAFQPITAYVVKCFGSAQPIRGLVR